MNSSKRCLTAFLCLVLSVIGTAGLTAGEIGDNLLQTMSVSQSGDFVRVVIIPYSTHSGAAMKASLVSRFATRAERHQAAMVELKDVARQTQADILPQLHALEQASKARNIKAFWVDNIIEAEIAVDEMSSLADNPHIARIDLYPKIVSFPAQKEVNSPLVSAAIPSNLVAINAPGAWALGYDGTGRIVCSFDSGVDALHPALSSNYRGNKGFPASECWFSPTDTTTVPHSFSEAGTSRPHGTHTTGTMVGHDDATGDTIGVAPGADWIAAATIDIPGTSIFESFQWAADPDGNPNTITDLPDVVNNSWGIENIGCSDLLWGVIDNLEALGIVVIFSAGNEGTAIDAIRSPANRADDSLTNFAVGAIQATDSTIYTTTTGGSSRGPSPCDGISIKPNVVAPGVQVRSSVLAGEYNAFTGTSMAAPHVSGAVAILRQKNPDATVDQIKAALLNSAHDLGTAGKDNTFGWGLIDIVAALAELDALTTPSIKVSEFDKPEFNPGGHYELSISLKNIGAAATNVSAAFSNPETGITLGTLSIDFGTINMDGEVVGTAPLVLDFASDVETGRFYSLDMTISADGDYNRYQKLNFYIGPEGERNFYTHENPTMSFTISNFGAFGFAGDSYTPYGYTGFRFNSTPNELYEAALLIGTDSAHISDCVRNVAQEPDNDFAVSGGGSIASFAPGPYADQETISFFDDSFAEHPLGLKIKQHSYIWTDAIEQEYMILQYVLTNISDSTIAGIRVGLYMDWDIYYNGINYYGQNYGGYYPLEQLGYMYYSPDVSFANARNFRGVKVLNAEGSINHRVFISPIEVYGSLFHEGRKAQGLFDDSRLSYDTARFDLAHITATGPFTLAAGAEDTAAFAILGGATWGDFTFNAAQASLQYGLLPTDIDDDSDPPLPSAFEVSQNYPNPFNPATTISFTIPKSGRVEIRVYDILGQTVRIISDGNRQAGPHTVVWDGKDALGHGSASGVYFYRVSFEGISLARKMVLMK